MVNKFKVYYYVTELDAGFGILSHSGLFVDRGASYCHALSLSKLEPDYYYVVYSVVARSVPLSEDSVHTWLFTVQDGKILYKRNG